MKLVELLAKEMIEWPKGFDDVGQADDGSLHLPGVGPHVRHTIEKYTKADDWFESIVTKAQWQAERDRQKGGEWRRHRGGKQPVADDVVVEYKLRDGYADTRSARRLSWTHEGCESDVMQYRVISQPQAEHEDWVGPFPSVPSDSTVNEIELAISYPSGVCSVEAKTEQMETPFKWRDEVTELNAYIEKYTRERDALIERLASEGFALIPPVVSSMSEFSCAGMIFPIEEWKIGDIVEVVSVSDESSAPLGVFKITDIDASEPKYELDDQYFPNHEQMKFIRRP